MNAKVISLLNEKGSVGYGKQVIKETDAFLGKRRFDGIVDRNMGTVSLYLERFFSFLSARSVTEIQHITGHHVEDYLKLLTGYSNQSKDHMMRTVRQFLKFCFQNGYHPEDLSPYAPNVHYEKRSRIPSAYILVALRLLVCDK